MRYLFYSLLGWFESKCSGNYLDFIILSLQIIDEIEWNMI